MKNYSNYEVNDFTADSRFVNWVLSPDSDSIDFWNRFLIENPYQAANIEEAKKLIYSLRTLDSAVSQNRLDIIWKDINSKTSKTRRFNFFVFGRWAAIALLLISIGLVTYNNYYIPGFEFSEQPAINTENAKLVLADGSIKSFVKEESEIEVNTVGEIILNSDTIKSTLAEEKNGALNHVVMPYGKQIRLQLPDGTLVYVNAGTKFSFPSKFEGSKREVYLKGEALFDVAENKKKPFIVHTSDIDIYVTGTEFNVSAYDDDNYTQAVLVSGEVKVSKPGILNKKIKILPGESALYNKKSGKISTMAVDAEIYTIWTKGYLIFKGEILTNVFKKLERFYDVKIVVQQQMLHTRSFSGKLDIQKDIESVLEDLSFASTLRVQKKEEEQTLYIIKP
jgi:hypothetical protein